MSAADRNPQATATALLVIDLQQALCDAAPSAPMASVLTRIKSLLGWARLRGHPVIFVQHWTDPDPLLKRGSAGWQLAETLQGHRPDFHVEKNVLSCFDDGALQAWLEERGITRLCIAGMQTNYCIDTACRVGSDLGYEVVLLTDAHMTIDGPRMSATEIVAEYNNNLAALAECRLTAAVIAGA